MGIGSKVQPGLGQRIVIVVVIDVVMLFPAEDPPTGVFTDKHFFRL